MSGVAPEQGEACKATTTTKSAAESVDVQPASNSASNVLQLAQTSSRHLQPTDVLLLQRTVGNRAVASLLGNSRTQSAQSNGPVVQTKLTVGPAQDRFEREADEVADRVVRTPLLQPHSRQPQQIQREPVIHRIQRKQSGAPKIGAEGGKLDPSLERNIQRAQSGGSPLPGNVRTHLEATLATDLSQVKVHTDSRAVQLNRDLGAKAFTHKNHIFYGAGQSPKDLRLTAHEAVHTIQQGAVRRTPDIQRLTVNNTAWHTVTDAKVPGGGVGGVIFLHDGNDEVVLKPLKEPPQRVMLAQDLMRDQGLTTAETRPVAPGSAEGQSIIASIQSVINRRNDQSVDKSSLPYGANVDVARLQSRLDNNIKNGRTILVMEKMDVVDMTQLDTEAPQKGIDPLKALGDMNFWKKLGKQAAIDFFLGNEDRLESMKVQNIFIDAAGELIAMDNDAAFFAPILEYTKMERKKQTRAQISRKQWLDVAVGGGSMWKQDVDERQDRFAGNMEYISGNVNEVTTKIADKAGELVDFLANGYRGQAIAVTLLNNKAQIIQHMVQGAIEARNRLSNMMLPRTGGRKSLLEEKFDTQEQTYKQDFGSDPLYHKFGFNVKKEYFKERERGSTPDNAKKTIGDRHAQTLVDKAGTKNLIVQQKNILDGLLPDDVKQNDRTDYDHMISGWQDRIVTSGTYRHVKDTYLAAIDDIANSRARTLLKLGVGFAQRARVDVGRLPAGADPVEQAISGIDSLIQRTAAKKSRLSKVKIRRRSQADRMIGQLSQLKTLANRVKTWQGTAGAAYS